AVQTPRDGVDGGGGGVVGRAGGGAMQRGTTGLEGQALLTRLEGPARSQGGRLSDLGRRTDWRPAGKSCPVTSFGEPYARPAPDPDVTLRVYAHIGLVDQTAPLDAPPDLSTPAPGPEAAARAATRTDGRPTATPTPSVRRSPTGPVRRRRTPHFRKGRGPSKPGRPAPGSWRRP